MSNLSLRKTTVGVVYNYYAKESVKQHAESQTPRLSDVNFMSSPIKPRTDSLLGQTPNQVRNLISMKIRLV